MDREKSTNSLSYHSDTITLDNIISDRIFFKIPIYQRLYVWGKEQIHALLSDVLSSYKKGDSENRRIFYLGNVIVQEASIADKTVYELIDGQQRFTTMWLLSIYLQNELKDYAFPQEKNKEKGRNGRPPLRIEFDIRDQVSDFMHEIVEHYNDEEHSDDLDLKSLVSKNPQRGFDTGTLEPLANAFKEIKTFFLNHVEDDIDPNDFSEYVRKKVKLVKTVVPESADLNKLFEVLNNRGVQLEHHQILKARMLEILNKGKNTLTYNTGHYAELWDSCSEMKEFLEKGFQDAVGKRLSELDSYDRKTSGYGFYKKAENVLSDLKALDAAATASNGSGNGESELYEGGLSLDKVLENKELVKEKRYSKASKQEYLDERSQEIKSIINFPMLLQHTLRIYLKERDRPDIDRVLDKELLDTFEHHFFSYLEDMEPHQQAREAADFIELLWEVRFVFDKFVVKWIKDKGTDILLLCSLYEKKDDKKVYLYRKAEEYKPELSQLQRLLYHSQEMRTFYWLTPFLYFLVTYYDRVNEEKKQDLELKYLKYLDNFLLNIDLSHDSLGPLIDRTLSFMEEVKKGQFVRYNKYQPTVEPLKKSLGLGFPHYWFYKLEFLLWRSMKENRSEIPDGMGVSEEDISDFKITAKNSVEHITPQNPRDAKAQTEVADNKDLLDCFGNLALVSRSLNSSLSNASYKLKREKFNESNDVRQRIESLKLLHVYAGNKENWLKNDIREHQERMIQYFENYIGKCKKEYEKLWKL